MTEKDSTTQLVKRLLETTQDIFIFQSLKSGLSGDVIKGVLRIDTDRVTRVSKLLPKRLRKQGPEK
jgi:hypothetical protein